MKANEILGLQLLSQHNIAFMTRMMQLIRSAILQGRFFQTKEKWLKGYG